MSLDRYASLGLKWTNYIPHQPTVKQLAFLLLKHKEALYGGAAGGGKMLRLDEPVPTPDGWSTIGSLSPGDSLFAADGKPTQVVAVFDIAVPRHSYLLEFDDGSTIEACEDHLWLTFDYKQLTSLTRLSEAWREKRRSRRPSKVLGNKSEKFTAAVCLRNRTRTYSVTEPSSGSVRTTKEIVQTLKTARGRTNHAIPVAGRLDLPEVSLPLDPYLLGVWLGDGTSLAGSITSADDEIFQAFVDSGFGLANCQCNGSRAKTQAFYGLVQKLREVGVFPKNKHVPITYLRASVQQRLALLQGLMDTDGTVCSSGSVEFTTTNKQLACSTHELIISLGWKARLIESKAFLNGRAIGPKWDIKWTPTEYVFRLDRKRCKQKLASRRTTKFRYVVSAVEVSASPMRCIKVANDDGLFLVGRNMLVTHNSDALLMGALQYVDYPGYSALLLRKTLTDLKQPGALLDRAMQWLQGTDARWEGSTHTWTFPTLDAYGNPSVPSKITFGYIGESQAYLRYQGIEIQYCAFDEVTQHVETDYRYLFSRLRKLVCPVHKMKDGKPNYVKDCPICMRQQALPIRMRAATNPGGPGAAWVKRRFRIGPDIDLREAAAKGIIPRYIGHHRKRPFVPSFAKDNPYLDLESYGDALDELDPVTREQLKEGRWDVSPNSRFKRHWARYYTTRSDHFVLGNESHHCDSLLRIFCTVDPAASSKHGPGDIDVWKKDPSFTVISVWGVTRNYHLIWLDMVRFRKEVPEVIMAMKTVNRIWHPDSFYVEANGLGQGVYQGAIREGLTVQPVHTRSDKVVNASEAMIRMSQGRIWFPESASWLETAEDEIFLWTGDPIRTDDIIDSLSNAARQVAWDDPVVIPDNMETGTFDNHSTDYPSIFYDSDFTAIDTVFPNY